MRGEFLKSDLRKGGVTEARGRDTITSAHLAIPHNTQDAAPGARVRLRLTTEPQKAALEKAHGSPV